MHPLIRVLVVTGSLALADSATQALADGLENGDFAHGKSKWLGEGQVVYLKPDGTISPTDDSKPTSLLATPAPTTPSNPQSAAEQKPTTTPLIEFKLHPSQFADMSQRFRTGKGAGALNVELVYKGTSDFKLNDKATVFTKDITWGPGSLWYWTAQVYPKVDLFMRLDKRDTHCYKLVAVSPGGAWQTAKFRWDNVGENQDVTFHVLAAPGHGSLYLKSVAISQ